MTFTYREERVPMPHPDIETLQKELDSFRAEKERVRTLIGQIGGKKSSKKDSMINMVFIILIIVLFILDVLRHLFHISVPLPPLFSIEVGILLVSVKIIWMIHKQQKVEHFQFWILNSIEFMISDISKRLWKVEDYVKANTSTEQEASLR